MAPQEADTNDVPWSRRPRPRLWSFDSGYNVAIPPALGIGSWAAAIYSLSAGRFLSTAIWGLVAAALTFVCVVYLRRPIASKAPREEGIDWSLPGDDG